MITASCVGGRPPLQKFRTLVSIVRKLYTARNLEASANAQENGNKDTEKVQKSKH